MKKSHDGAQFMNLLLHRYIAWYDVVFLPRLTASSCLRPSWHSPEYDVRVECEH